MFDNVAKFSKWESVSYNFEYCFDNFACSSNRGDDRFLFGCCDGNIEIYTIFRKMCI